MGQLVPVSIGLAFVGLNSLIAGRRSSTTRQTVEGSKIDTNTPKAEYGGSVDIFYGTVKKNGLDLIWAQPLREERIESEESETQGSGGKGGGARQTTVTTNVTYNYYLTGAYLIGGAITEVNRVWLDGTLVYSKTSSGTDKSQTFLNHTTIYTGTNSQSPDPTIQSYEGNDIPALRLRSYLVFDDYPIAEYEGSGFPVVDVELVGEEANNTVDSQKWCYIEDVLENLLVKSGIEENRINTSKLTISSQNNLPGYIFTSGKTWRSGVEELQQLFFLVVVEMGDLVLFYHQNAIDLLDEHLILERFLGTTVDSTELPYIQKQLNTEAVYAASSIDFLDIKNNLKENTVSGFNPSYTHNNTLDIKTTASLTTEQALDVVDRVLSESDGQNFKLEKLALMPTWSTLLVGDLFVLIKENDERISQVFQITKRVRGVNFLIELEAVRYKQAIDLLNVTFQNSGVSDQPIPVLAYGAITIPSYTEYDTGETDFGFNTPDETSDYGTAEAIPLDLPLLRDTDIAPLLCIAIKELSNWDTGSLYLSNDNELSYQFTQAILSRSLLGTVAVALPDHASALFDKVNTIRVVMDNNNLTVDPVTNEEFLKGTSYLLLGSEIIAFRDVVVVSNDPLTYDISHLKRGHRGTEYYTDKHTTNEQLIILSGYKLKISSQANLVNQTLHFKAVGDGQSEPVVTNSSSLVIEGNSIKPIPPLPVLGDRSGNDLTISWYRRTRIGGGLVDYAEIGYAGGELREYQLEILDTGTVVRTVNITGAESYLYSEAQQIADFGSAQSEVDVRVRQKSSYPVALNLAKVVKV